MDREISQNLSLIMKNEALRFLPRRGCGEDRKPGRRFRLRFRPGEKKLAAAARPCWSPPAAARIRRAFRSGRIGQNRPGLHRRGRALSNQPSGRLRRGDVTGGIQLAHAAREPRGYAAVSWYGGKNPRRQSPPHSLLRLYRSRDAGRRPHGRRARRKAGALR